MVTRSPRLTSSLQCPPLSGANRRFHSQADRWLKALTDAGILLRSRRAECPEPNLHGAQTSSTQAVTVLLNSL